MSGKKSSGKKWNRARILSSLHHRERDRDARKSCKSNLDISYFGQYAIIYKSGHMFIDFLQKLLTGFLILSCQQTILLLLPACRMSNGKILRGRSYFNFNVHSRFFHHSDYTPVSLFAIKIIGTRFRKGQCQMVRKFHARNAC